MIWKLVMIMALVMLVTGSGLYEANVTPKDFKNATEKVHYDNLNLTFNEMGDNQNNSFFIRAIYKCSDFYGFTLVEGSRTALRYGYEHPQYNFRFVFNLLILALVCTILLPLIYILLFIGEGIYYLVLWIKKVIHKRRVKQPK